LGGEVHLRNVALLAELLAMGSHGIVGGRRIAGTGNFSAPLALVPVVVAEFISHDSPPQFGSLNHV
jgi:hypothetical protein